MEQNLQLQLNQKSIQFLELNIILKNLLNSGLMATILIILGKVLNYNNTFLNRLLEWRDIIQILLVTLLKLNNMKSQIIK